MYESENGPMDESALKPRADLNHHLLIECSDILFRSFQNTIANPYETKTESVENRIEKNP